MRRVSRALLAVRDVGLLVFSFVIAGSSYGKWVNDPIFYIVFGLAAPLFPLSLVDVILVAKNVKRKAYFYINGIVQLPILGLFGGLFQPVLAFLFLDIVILATLGEKKTAEELAAHPPVPITRNYRILVFAGVLAVVVSMLLPWLSTADASISIVGFYIALASHSGLPAISIQPAQVVLALLAVFLPPFSLALGAVGLVRRRLSLVSGSLAVVAGGCMLALLGPSAGVGA
ncbi:MAG: hypothetical protein HY296_00530 [Thaumarchaeota archaeon]|nr:hypothetical protein [Nitrososphaerota archaeon]